MKKKHLIVLFQIIMLISSLLFISCGKTKTLKGDSEEVFQTQMDSLKKKGILKEKFNVQYTEESGNNYNAIVKADEYELCRLDIMKNGKAAEEFKNEELSFGKIEKINFILSEDREHSSLFVHEESGGSGAMTNLLYMINLKSGSIINLEINISFDANFLPAIERSDNFNEPQNSSDAKYLEKIKNEYGYFTDEEVLKNETDLTYSDYAWCLYNGKIDEGKLKIIKYDFKKSKVTVPEEEASSDLVLEDGNIKYYAYFRSALEAYDLKNKEYYVVFYPRSSTCSVSDVKKYKNYLLIGTYCEGLVIINTKTFYIKRMNLNDMEITEIEVKGNKIVLNGEKEVPVPEF